MAFVTFLFRQRFLVLGVLVVLAAAGVGAGLYGRAVPVGALFLTAISLAVAFGVAFVHLRHVALAVVVAVAALPGMIAMGTVASVSGVGMLAVLAAYGFALIAGTLWCAEAVRGVAGGGERGEAALARPMPLLAAVTLAAAVASAVSVGWLFKLAAPLAVGVAGEVAAGTVSALLLVAAAIMALPFSEGAIIEINRAAERRAVRLRLLTMVVEPRWGLSLAGIAVVLAVLGYFGIVPMLGKGSLIARPAYWAAAALLVFVVAFLVSRDWREALAATLATAVQTLLGLWLWGFAVGHLTTLALVVVVTVDGVALMLILSLLVRSRWYRGEGDAFGVARLKALEDCAVPAIYGCAAAGAAIVPWIVLHGSMVTLALLFVLAAGAATIAMPAIATALEALLRRRFSVEELYGRG